MRSPKNFKCNNILLLCHGKKYPVYSKYFKRSTTVDYEKKCQPDIVCDLKNGLPKQNKKFDLIQSVYWPQLHRSYLYFDENGKLLSLFKPSFKVLRNRVIANDEYTFYNFKLLKSICDNLKFNGFLVFYHKGNFDILNQMMKVLNMELTNLDFVENKCGFKIKPKSNNFHTLICFQKKIK